jgi:hypothetical protein
MASNPTEDVYSVFMFSYINSWGTMLQAGRSPVRVPDEVDFSNLRNTSSRAMAVGSNQPLTEMRTTSVPEGKKQPARTVDNLAAICEPNV